MCNYIQVEVYQHGINWVQQIIETFTNVEKSCESW
jgi:hypothetical protein